MLPRLCLHMAMLTARVVLAAVVRDLPVEVHVAPRYRGNNNSSAAAVGGYATSHHGSATATAASTSFATSRTVTTAPGTSMLSSTIAAQPTRGTHGRVRTRLVCSLCCTVTVPHRRIVGRRVWVVAQLRVVQGAAVEITGNGNANGNANANANGNGNANGNNNGNGASGGGTDGVRDRSEQGQGRSQHGGQPRSTADAEALALYDRLQRRTNGDAAAVALYDSLERSALQRGQGGGSGDAADAASHAVVGHSLASTLSTLDEESNSSDLDSTPAAAHVPPVLHAASSRVTHTQVQADAPANDGARGHGLSVATSPKRRVPTHSGPFSPGSVVEEEEGLRAAGGDGEGGDGGDGGGGELRVMQTSRRPTATRLGLAGVQTIDQGKASTLFDSLELPAPPSTPPRHRADGHGGVASDGGTGTRTGAGTGSASRVVDSPHGIRGRVSPILTPGRHGDAPPAFFRDSIEDAGARGVATAATAAAAATAATTAVAAATVNQESVLPVTGAASVDAHKNGRQPSSPPHHRQRQPVHPGLPPSRIPVLQTKGTPAQPVAVDVPAPPAARGAGHSDVGAARSPPPALPLRSHRSTTAGSGGGWMGGATSTSERSAAAASGPSANGGSYLRHHTASKHNDTFSAVRRAKKRVSRRFGASGKPTYVSMCGCACGGGVLDHRWCAVYCAVYGVLCACTGGVVVSVVWMP